MLKQNSLSQWLWILIFAVQAVSAHAASSIEARTLRQLDRQVYGENPLQPSPDSMLGRYISETKAYTVVRTFKGADGQPGPERLVVLVSAESFPIFQKYFDEAHFLFHFHEPHQRILSVAYQGHRGTMGRLRDTFRYTYSGVLAIPILLTDSEADRATNFFNLALNTSRKNDVALYPWKLTSADGSPYMPSGDEKSLSDWFLRMPIGKTSVFGSRTPYDLEKVPEAIRSTIGEVWSAPFGHQPLVNLIHARSLKAKGAVITPGRIGAALVAEAPITRVPVIFRFTRDAIDPFKVDNEAVTKYKDDFSPYFDLAFDPAAEEGKK